MYHLLNSLNASDLDDMLKDSHFHKALPGSLKTKVDL